MIWLFTTAILTYSLLARCQNVSRFEQQKIQSEANCLRPILDTTNPKLNVQKDKGCVIYYVHNHKSGGTTICNTVANAGHIIHKKLNCNIPSHNRSDWPGLIRSMGLTFVAQEDAPFQPLLDTNNYLYMTTIRDPYDRLVSHLHHEFCGGTLIHAKAVVERLNCTFDIEKASLTEIVMSDCFDTPRFWHINSNFYLQMFAGCVGQTCGPSNLEQASAVMQIMSVILLTNSPEEYDR